MEALANYNEILPGITGIPFPQDLKKVVIQIKSTFRSILSRMKALQAIRTFSKKLNAFLIGEEKAEQFVQPVVEPVVPEPVQIASSVISEPVQQANIETKPALSAVGARSVMADKEISSYITRGENRVDKASVEEKIQSETSLSSPSVSIEPVPHVEDSIPTQMQDLTVKLPFDIETNKTAVQLDNSTVNVDHSVVIPFPMETEPVKVDYTPTDLSVKIPFELVETKLDSKDSVELSVQSVESQALETSVEENSDIKDEQIVNPTDAIKGLRELVDTNEHLSTENARLSTENKELSNMVSLKDSELGRLSEEKVTLSTQVNELNESLRTKEEELASTKITNEALNNELQASKGQIIEFGKAVQKLNIENKALTEQLNTMTSAINEALGGFQKAA